MGGDQMSVDLFGYTRRRWHRHTINVLKSSVLMFWLVCLYNLPTVVTWLVVMGDVLTITDQFPENIECRSHPAPPSRTHYDITIRGPCPGVTGAQFEVIMRGECVIRWMRPTLSDTRRNYLDIAVILVIREQEAGPGTWHNQIISGPG